MIPEFPGRADIPEASGVARSAAEVWTGVPEAQSVQETSGEILREISVEVDVQEEGAIASPVLQDTWITWFQTWLTALAPDLSPIGAYELSLRLTTDAEIHQLNAQYRQIDRPTDVLSFSATESGVTLPAGLLAEEPFPLGDIIISLDTAAAQAQQRHHTLTEELAWLATHGLLHLLGWDHPDEAHLQKMLQQQVNLLQTVALEVQYD
ncbi:rRNA maturation RNase YbeY [Thermoleptolyngbya sichuanensis XZ-Cy5]|uniref:rRNA maturation RNase YbeY n=1 Tax=Thermoleptolyngbya sichuanensis TaxID=2885951 RepID=UPI00240D2267|nr:rRNA maturation RNase YbeY [Thermoleptolyngbya sichuanensis]MDG2614996.1 rRNA maturation RNase YbeY [Thermoleptolyngbya sichuanensis XZ-Cy5]